MFRTEHHSRKLGQAAALPLMGVVMLSILTLSAGASLVSHPQEVQNLVRHPALLRGALSALTMTHCIPVLWTGLFSTDAVLLIEVGAEMCCLLVPHKGC